ncbi:hypothetical protein [Thermocrispum municipale]|uniref:hypothetical protein n=1 Tax=Thermocrispum municipale TaxID=37926 RepID=UPI00069366AF|nr:hypothetical protein [Thermocrispum municipale]
MINAIVNKVAMERYRDFLSATDEVMLALIECDQHIKRLDRKKSQSSWVACTAQELRSFQKKAMDQISELRKVAKNHEAELISREWRL